MRKKIKFIEVESELAAGTRGASLGIGAIKTASLNKKSDLFKVYESVLVKVHNEMLWDDEFKYPHAKHIDGVYQVLSNVSKSVSKEIKNNNLVVLAGDHSTAAGTISGIKEAYPLKRLGVIWIDAHADIHSPYTTESGNMHGMPLAMVMQEDNLSAKLNTLDDVTLSYWEKCKIIGGAEKKLIPQDLVYITVRDTEKTEDDFIEKNTIKNFSYKEVQQKGIEKVAQESLDRLADCDLIYISFDVDSMDSKFSKATGTPVAGGLSPNQAKELNKLLVKSPKVVCWELAEVNPILGTLNKMAETTFDILEEVVAQMENKQ